MTENELLLNKIKELEIVLDDVQLLKTDIQRLRDKNSSDWNYWRKQQSDLYAQLRQHNNIKESILCKFDRLQKQVEYTLTLSHRIFFIYLFIYSSNQAEVIIDLFVILVLVQYR